MMKLSHILGLGILLAFAALAPTLTFAKSSIAKIERDISYGLNRLNRFDVYLPKKPQNAPVIFMVHGGAWFKGDKASQSVVANKVAYWLPKGYIFISTNYGLMPATNPLEQAHDIARALAKAQSLAPSWGGDPNKFTIMGHSSGAHLVALLAADPKIATLHGAKLWKSAVIIDSAAMDIPKLMKRGHARFYDKVFGRDPKRWRAMSPVHRSSAKAPPILAICSSRRAFSCRRSKGFANAVRKAGTFISVYPVPLSHSQLNSELGKKGRYTKAVADFIK